MDPYYSYRHFKEQKDRTERQSRIYQEYINSLRDFEDMKRSGYYSITRELYPKPRRRDFDAAAQTKPKMPEDGFWISTQQDAKGSFQQVSKKIDQRQKTESLRKAYPFRGIRPSY